MLEACARSCLELRDRLKMVVEAQAKEQQLTKKFDEIAVFDQADRRASELANIVRVGRCILPFVFVLFRRCNLDSRRIRKRFFSFSQSQP